MQLSVATIGRNYTALTHPQDRQQLILFPTIRTVERFNWATIDRCTSDILVSYITMVAL